MVTWQCDKTLEEMQQYLEQQLKKKEIGKEDQDNDNDSEDDDEEEPTIVRSSHDVSDEGRSDMVLLLEF